MTDNAPLQLLTQLLKNERDFVMVRTQDIVISYYTNLNCEMTVRVEDPRMMIDYLRAAFATGGNTLLTRFNRKDPVFVEVPGDVIDPSTNETKEKRLALLRFVDQNSPAQLHFNDDGVALEGPTLSAFIAALQKAGDDWEKVDLRPVEKPALRVVVKNHVLQP